MKIEPRSSEQLTVAAKLKHEFRMRLQAGDYGLHDVTPDVDGSVVTLRGRVDRIYSLRLAVEIALKTPGVQMLMTKVEADNSPSPERKTHVI